MFWCKFEAALLLSGHWPRGSTGRRPVRKKRPAKRVFFFWFPLRTRCSIRKWVNRLFPDGHIYLSIYLSSILWYHAATWSRAHSPGLEVSFSADRRCRFVHTVPLTNRGFWCRFLALACRKWCLNEEVELLCKLAMPRLSSGVWMKR